jgi:PEGA domain
MSRRILGSFGGLAFVPLLAAAPSFAEPTNHAVRMARKRFQEGVAAVDAGNYEVARVAFQQAYALKPHPSVLHNLGHAELRTGHYLEAARHLSIFVRDTTYGKPAQREAATKSLAEAEAHVGSVIIHVDVVGAEITVDGERAGRSPIVDPFYAEPGERVIRIQKDGYEAYEKTQLIEAGRTTQLKITLDVARAPTPAASVSRMSSSLVTPSTEETGSAVDVVGPPPTGLVPAEDSNTSVRTIALATTGGLALVSAGVWLGFALEGASLQRQADDLRNQVESARPTIQCARDEPPCDELRDVSQRRATVNTIAFAGGIATGVSAAAFLATFFFWPKSARRGAGAALLPAFAAHRAGLELWGAF